MLIHQKKREQKNQDYNLQMLTEQQMDGMHVMFKHIVKRIGGQLRPGDSQFHLQKYLKSSLV